MNEYNIFNDESNPIAVWDKLESVNHFIVSLAIVLPAARRINIGTILSLRFSYVALFGIFSIPGLATSSIYDSLKSVTSLKIVFLIQVLDATSKENGISGFHPRFSIDSLITFLFFFF